MSFKSIHQRVSMLAVLGLLPLALTAGEVREPFEAQQEGKQLIGQMEGLARNIHENADRLDALARAGQVSATSHNDHLMQIRSLVNDQLQPTLSRLTEIQEDLPEWQQDAVDQIFESARGLASSTNSAILSMNENGSRHTHLNPDYSQFVSQINEHVEAMVKTADAAGDYADAHEKAVEAGLPIPKS
jgi:hypothetical protein